MKKIERILICILFPFAFWGCESYLDLAPELDISEEDVYENYLTAQGYLDNCYKFLNDYSHYQCNQMDRNHTAGLSDEGSNTYGGGTIKKTFNKGQWLDQGTAGELGWKNGGNNFKQPVVANAYFCLRVANKALVNIPEMTSITQEEKDELIGQAYFFRAWYFFEVIRRYGGMPIPNRVFFSDDEYYSMPRESYQACSEQIIEDLDMAIDLLPAGWDNQNYGRADKVAAHALKGMVALYAASPLMQNGFDETLQLTEYDGQWSKDAAKYAMDAINFLNANYPEKQMKDFSGASTDDAAMLENYRHLFYFDPEFVGRTSLWYANYTGGNRNALNLIYFLNMRHSGASGNWGWAISTPAQNLVDLYEYNDGTPFDWNNPAHKADPFTNRDPRLYNNVYLPGEKRGSTYYVESWEKQDGTVGADINLSVPAKSLPTRYMAKKWAWESANKVDQGGNDYNSNGIFIRTVQLWLDYAEAMNEAYGPNADPEGYGYTAVEAINKVRARVAMPGVKSEFTGSKEAFRERIRNERSVELFYENHRWFDIRRWMIAEELFEADFPIKGIKAVVTNENGTTDQEQWSYSYDVFDVTTEYRVFERKHYWYPLPYDHIMQLSVLQQNPGW